MPLSEQTQTMSNDQAFSKEQEMEHACHITSFFFGLDSLLQLVIVENNYTFTHLSRYKI